VGSDIVPTVIAIGKAVKKFDDDNHKIKLDPYTPASSEHSTTEEFDSND
jgi:hypothetical protein